MQPIGNDKLCWLIFHSFRYHLAAAHSRESFNVYRQRCSRLCQSIQHRLPCDWAGVHREEGIDLQMLTCCQIDQFLGRLRRIQRTFGVAQDQIGCVEADYASC